MKNNIVLIGFMGCGKTTFGKWISRHYPYKFVDTDDCIVRAQKRTINDIFKMNGEDYFRNLETETVKELLKQEDGKVISVGGGLPVKEENRALLRELGTVVYLNTSKRELVRRLRNDKNRPLLAGGDIEKKVDTLMEQRRLIYEETAHLILSTDEKNFTEMYEEIVSYG